jgi:hypothetical protein
MLIFSDAPGQVSRPALNHFFLRHPGIIFSTPVWCLQKALQGGWDILQDSVSHIILPSSSSAGPLITPSQALKIGLLARDGAIALDLPTGHWQVLRHAG